MINHSRQYLDDLYDRGRRSFDDLNEDERATLTGFLVREERNQSHRQEYITETYKFDEMLTDLAEMLISKDLKDDEMYRTMRCSFAHNAMKGAVALAENRINAMFETRSLYERKAA